MENQSNLKCNQFDEALDAYHDLELSPAEAEDVERHLEVCSHCTARLADIESISSHLKALPAVELKRDLSDDIENRILALRRGAPDLPETGVVANSSVPGNNVVPFVRRSKKPYLLAGAAAVLALILGIGQFDAGRDSRKNLQAVVPKVVVPQNDKVENDTHDNLPITASAKPAVKKNREIDAVNDAKDIEGAKVAASKAGGATVDSAEKQSITNVAGNYTDAQQVDRNNNSVNDSEELLALYDDDTADSATDVGISTNEDGLYAIKL